MVSTAILFGLLSPFLLVGCLFIIIYIILIFWFFDKMSEITDGFRAERELWKSIKNLGKKANRVKPPQTKYTTVNTTQTVSIHFNILLRNNYNYEYLD